MDYQCTLDALTVIPGFRLYRCSSDIHACTLIVLILIFSESKVSKLIFWLYNVHVGPAELAMANLRTGTEKKNDESGASSTGE